MTRLFLIILIGTTVSCRTGKASLTESYRDSIPVVSFCDLPKYKGQQVYLKSYYSGVDEYWALSSTNKRKCSQKLRVDLQFAGPNRFVPPAQFEDVFLKVHESYHNSYLLLEAVGTFENDSKDGYGHLGSNNSRFVVSELITATMIKR